MFEPIQKADEQFQKIGGSSRDLVPTRHVTPE
jgi:hypothetical protein